MRERARGVVDGRRVDLEVEVGDQAEREARGEQLERHVAGVGRARARARHEAARAEDARGETALARGAHELLRHPLALRVAAAHAGEGGEVELFGQHRRRRLDVEDAGRGDVVEGLGASGAGEAQRLQRSADVGRLEQAVGLEEADLRAGVDDGVELAREALPRRRV